MYADSDRNPLPLVGALVMALILACTVGGCGALLLGR